MSTDKTSPSFPPDWTKTTWGKRLIKVNNEKKCLHPSFLAHLTITTAIVFGAVISYGIATFYIRHLASTWQICPTANNQSSKAQRDAAAKAPASTNPSKAPEVMWPDLSETRRSIDAMDGTILPGQKDRIKAQLDQIREAQSQSCKIGVYFFSNRAAGQTVSTAAAVVAISSLAFLSKKGWENTNNAVINIGVTSGLVLFTTWTFGQLYGQSINYENQRTKFVLATNLLNRVSSAVANRNLASINSSQVASMQPINPDIKPNTSESMGILIESIDQELAVINDLKFEGDSSFAESSVKSIGQFFNQSRPSQPPLPNR
jgi:hypothetical protein